MIPDIGLMIGAYAIARLVLLMYPATPGQRAPALYLVVVVPAVLIIALMTVDLVMQGSSATTQLGGLGIPTPRPFRP